MWTPVFLLQQKWSYKVGDMTECFFLQDWQKIYSIKKLQIYRKLCRFDTGMYYNG